MPDGGVAAPRALDERLESSCGPKHTMPVIGTSVQTDYPPPNKAGQEPPKDPVVEGLGLWSWMFPPPGPEPPNV